MSNFTLTPTVPPRRDVYKRFQMIRKGVWTILLPELLAFDSICSIGVCIITSYYIYKLGYFLGAQSSTPQMASILSDKRVLQGSFYPHEVRLYAQVLLCMTIGTLVWSISLGLKTLEYESTRLGSTAVSPKLPFSTPIKYTPLSGSFVSTSPRQPPSAIRSACISRIKKFVVLFCFCFAFLRRQSVSTTLIYHPVNSPLLQLAEHSGKTLQQDSEEEVEVFSNLEGLREDGIAFRHNITVVPPIVHFVFGLDESFGGKPFAFAHYLSMYSGKLGKYIP